MLEQRTQQKSITEVRILEAAVQLFSRQGFGGTGTREIAQLADVHETTLFRYYRTKKVLFWAALETRLERIKLGRELQSGLSGDEDPARVLPMLVAFLVGIIRGQPELMRMLYVSALELPGADDVYRKHLGAIFDSISSYMRRSTVRGAICDIDPHIGTLGLLGTVIAHANLYQLFTGCDLPFANTAEASTAYSTFWMNMLAKSGQAQPTLQF